jgi:hypothetical protein
MAGNTKDPQPQLDIQSQINKVLSERTAILSAQEKALSSQVQLAIDLCKALKCDQLDEIEARLKTTRDEMKRAADEAKNYGGALADAADTATKANEKTVRSVKDLWESFKELNPVVAGAATGLGVGLVRGLGSAFQTTKNLITGIGGIISTLGKLAFTIIGLPFRLLEGLFDLAQGSGGGPSPILVELENIRKQFGSLKTNEGAAAAGALREFTKDYSNLAGTGLSIRRIFGQGLEGIAKALAENAEVAKELGAAFNASMDIIRRFGPELAVYRKGMGFTAAQQAMLIKTTRAMGGDPMDRMRKIGSMAIQMGRQFGVNTKVITQGIGEMVADFPHFGSLGEKAMGQIATYAHKLGIEIKDLTGMIDAFDDFEDAATRTAKLAQSFQLNLDTMKMLDEQDPAARLYEFQKAWKATGRSYEQLNRAEKKQLSTLANIPDAALAAAVGTRGLAMSYADVQKAGAKAEKQQMSQEEVLKNLADSIERVFGSGGGTKFKGFFDAFTQGFTSGIMRAKLFRQAMRAIRRSLMVVFRAGRAVGKMFVNLFPGIKQVLVGIKELFNPRRFYGFMEDVKKAFSRLFKDLRTDPKAGIERFLKTFRDRLANFFKASGPGAKGLLEGGKEFLKTLWKIFQAVFPMVVDGLASAARAIAEFLRNPPDIQSPITEALLGLKDALMPLFSILAEKLWPALVDMFTAMWEKAEPYVTKWGQYILYAALLKIFVHAIYGAVVGAIGAAIGKVLATGALKLFEKLFKIAAPPPPPKTPPDVSKGGGWGKFLMYLGAILVAAGILMVAYHFLKMKPEDAVAIGILILALVGSALLISFALKAMPEGDWKKDAFKLGLLAGFIAVIGGVALGIVAALSQIPTGNLLATAPAFMSVMLSLVIATIPLIIISAVLGAMKGAIDKAIVGMVVIGGFMGAIGVLGVIITGFLSKFEPAALKSAASMLMAISSLMMTVMVMLPVALAVGLLAGAEPFGIIGLGIMTVGFEVIAGLALLLVGTLLPAIRELAAIKIPNPASFSAVVSALTGIIDAISKFVAMSALLATAVGMSSDIDTSSFDKNIGALSKLVDTIVKQGLGEIINKFLDFAKNTQVREGTGAVIAAIASVLSAAASIMQAFSPSEEAGKAIMQLEALSMVLQATGVFGLLSGGGAGGSRMIQFVKDSMARAVGFMTIALPQIRQFIVEMISALSGMNITADVSKIAPLIGAIAPMITAVSAVMKSLSPSDAAWSALVASTDLSRRLIGNTIHTEFTLSAEAALTSFGPVLKHLKNFVVDIIRDIKDPLMSIMSSLKDVPIKSLEVAIPLVAAVLSFASDMMSAIGPVISSSLSAAEGAPEGQKLASFTKALDASVAAMKSIGPILLTLVDPMKLMIDAVIGIARGIKDSRGLKGKIEIVTAALQAVGAMSSIFKSGGDLGVIDTKGGINESAITNIANSMKLVTTHLLQSDGPLYRMAKALTSLNFGNTKSIKGNADAIKNISEGVRAVAESFAPGSGIVLFGSTTFGLDTGLFTEINKKIALFTTGPGSGIFTGMANIVNQIPEGVSDRSESITNMVATLETLSRSLNTSQLSDSDISTFVQLNNALRGDGHLTIKHQNLNISLNVHVEMSAEQIATGIIKVNDVNRDVKGRQKFVTENA